MRVHLFSVGANVADASESVTAVKDIVNGTFGAVTGDVFANSANGTYLVDDIEVGDTADMEGYVITAGKPFRVIDLTKIAGKKLVVPAQLFKTTPEAGQMFASDATGILVKASTKPSAGVYFTVDKTTPFNGVGAVVTIAVV